MLHWLEQFKQFAVETKLHGVRRLFEGNRRWTNLFWAALVVISFVMAARDLIQLVNLYQSKPTVIQISQSNDTFAWKTPTLCMEFLASYSNASSNLHDIATPIDWNSPTLGLPTELFDELFSITDLDNYTTVHTVVISNPNVLYYTYMMLSYWSEWEQQLIGGTLTSLKASQFNHGYNDILVAERAQHFYDFYKQMYPAVTLTRLSKVLGMWFCLQQFRGLMGLAHVPYYPTTHGHFENYRYFGDPQFVDLPLCKADMITFLGFSRVCSNVFESPTVPFVPGYKYFAIYNSFTTYPIAFTNTIDLSPGVALLQPNYRWYLDVDGRDVLPPASDRTNVFSWNPGEHVVVDISVATEYRYLNRPVRPCSSAAESQSQCQRRKQMEFVYEQCGCWPSLVGAADVLLNAVNCSDFNFVDQYLPAAKIYNLTSDMLQCGATMKLEKVDLSDCLFDCQIAEKKLTQQLTKKFMWNRWWSTSRFYQKVGSIEFRYTADPHLLITESLQLEWSTFIGSWGGSIGTWLGASILAFTHIPVFLLRQWFRRTFAN